MRKLTLLCALAVCLPATGGLAVAEPLDAAAEWLREHYTEAPIGGGWRVTRIDRVKRDLYVGVVLPRADAASLRSLPPERQVNLVALVCPSTYAEVWEILPAKSRIVVHDAADGLIFGAVSCRR